MAVIGVDSSGKIDQLPCFIVAVRGTSCYCIRVTQIDRTDYVSATHWREKLTAIYSFRAIRKLYRKGDMVEFDDDFVGSRNFFKNYLDYLLNAYYHFEINTREGRRDTSKHIASADWMSKVIRKKPEKAESCNPSIDKEWDVLKKK